MAVDRTTLSAIAGGVGRVAADLHDMLVLEFERQLDTRLGAIDARLDEFSQRLRAMEDRAGVPAPAMVPARGSADVIPEDVLGRILAEAEFGWEPARWADEYGIPLNTILEQLARRRVRVLT